MWARAHRNDVDERRLARVLQADECQLHLLLEEETVRRESRVREVGVGGSCAVAACLRSQLSIGSSHDWNHEAPAAAIAFPADSAPSFGQEKRLSQRKTSYDVGEVREEEGEALFWEVWALQPRVRVACAYHSHGPPLPVLHALSRGAGLRIRPVSGRVSRQPTWRACTFAVLHSAGARSHGALRRALVRATEVG